MYYENRNKKNILNTNNAQKRCHINVKRKCGKAKHRLKRGERVTPIRLMSADCHGA
jgi:hypothetical protein